MTKCPRLFEGNSNENERKDKNFMKTEYILIKMGRMDQHGSSYFLLCLVYHVVYITMARKTRISTFDRVTFARTKSNALGRRESS